MSATKEFLSRLYLLGTVHGDPKGYKKLKSFLNSFKPDLILLELSPFAWAFRTRHQAYFQNAFLRHLKYAARRLGLSLQDALKHPQILAIRRQINLPYEYRAARAHVLHNEAMLFLVDHSSFSREWIAAWAELISVENLTFLLTSFSRVSDIEHTYRQALDSITRRYDLGVNGLFGDRDSEGKDWDAREHYVARQIQETLLIFQPRRALYVGGWWHLTSGGRLPTLRDLLKAKISRCYLLERESDLSLFRSHHDCS
jgi:hypothetical protein